MWPFDILVSSMPETSGIHVQPFLQAPDAMPLDSMIGLRKYISHPMRLPMLLWLSPKFYNSRILFKGLQQKPGTLASVQIRWLARCWIVSRHKSSGCDVEMGLIQSCCSLPFLLRPDMLRIWNLHILEFGNMELLMLRLQEEPRFFQTLILYEESTRRILFMAQ